MGVDIEIVIGGKIEIFFALDQGGSLGRPVVANKKRVFHPHFGAHFHKPIKGELGTHTVKAGSAAFVRNGGLFRRRGAGLTGMVVLHASSSRVILNLPEL